MPGKLSGPATAEELDLKKSVPTVQSEKSGGTIKGCNIVNKGNIC